MFWKEVNSCLETRQKRNVGEKITTEEWFDHFSDVFQSDGPHPRNDPSDPGDLPDVEELDGVITEQEVRTAIKRIKCGKACGSDKILPEMLKTAGEIVVGFLTKLFNQVFNSGIYPDKWREAIIVPVFKKGNRDSPNNYRGISLLSLIAKCYTNILNARLYSWLEDNKKITDTQAGFRKGYSTSDHIFTLY